MSYVKTVEWIAVEHRESCLLGRLSLSLALGTLLWSKFVVQLTTLHCHSYNYNNKFRFI
jgi:hypothetical protein